MKKMEGAIIIGVFFAIFLLLPKKLEGGTDGDILPNPDGGGNDNNPLDFYLQQNLRAFLKTIQFAEGTFNQANPYAVTYAYDHVIKNFSDHPAKTGEWTGVILPDRFCKAVGLNPGCKSTASGAYQINKPTWDDFINRGYPIPDFSPDSQDELAKRIIIAQDSLNDVYYGRIEMALEKLGNRWASFPSSTAGQGGKTIDQLVTFYLNQGGLLDTEINNLILA